MGGTDCYRIHDIEWSDEKVARFWDNYAKTPGNEGRYFSDAAGGAVLAIFDRVFSIENASLLDFGSGPARLFGAVRSRYPSVKYFALDFSPDSVNAAVRRFGHDPQFQGAALVESLPQERAGKFDCATMLEVVEHLDDDNLRRALRHLHSFLKPGGYVCITTPNAEDLMSPDVRITCPDCGCRFHRMQHVRSWTAETLSSVLSLHGFKVASSKTTILGGKRMIDRAFARLKRFLQFTGLAQMLGCSFPDTNLIVVARKVEMYSTAESQSVAS